MTPFGTTVLMWRTERRLSQDALAKQAGVSRPNLSGIERGKREVSLKTLRALALALEVTPGALVDGVAPGRVNRGRFSRARLETIADAVIKQTPVRHDDERQLTRLLQTLLHTRLAALPGHRAPLRVGKRQLTKAWLQLSALYPSEVIHSVMQRIGDRERLLRRSG